MAKSTAAEIQAAVQNELADTPYAATSLRALSGGNANFIYHAKLQAPLPDGRCDVVVKHGEGYVATSPEFAITVARCKVEEAVLRYMARFPAFPRTFTFHTRTPTLLYFNPATSTNVQEYLPEAMSLKHYALQHFKTATADSLARPHCYSLGLSLGMWLRMFHRWVREGDNSALRDLVAANTEMQAIKKRLNYDNLPQSMARHQPDVGDCRDMFKQVADMAAAELRDSESLHVIHGDFWTGNILLPDAPIGLGRTTQVFVVDWEMAQLGVQAEDFGQLVAELWQLKLYAGIDAGIWIIEGFAEGYGRVDLAFILRAVVHVAAHLIAFGSNTPGWGTPEQNKEVALVGKETMKKALSNDMQAFRGHPLQTLFRYLGINDIKLVKGQNGVVE
ncbi:kinase-like domain [Cordyceps militaris]|uniref:Kinase-like domain n=1 Tax=Cordyceps militaris TaxID=73501 RepID=A0A2H4SCW3_CORMI|nr:kinase-like domain [Cordyceps militaris]